jgi:hypothetical protein
MANASYEISNRVVKFVQELLLDEGDRVSVTPAAIAEKIAMVLAMKPSWGENLDRDAITDELIRRFSLWVGQDTTLHSNAGHEDWLNSSRKQDWRYWQRYREWLERKLSWKAVEALDRSTDSVLGLLEDPLREGNWDRRGLVVGHVQSGKTGNYTGLICKAADAGYKIIIVLAGLHNNLRSQTQMRLDEGFLGYETKMVADDIRIIGVGEIDGDPAIRPNYATNRSEKGDFNTSVARNLGITPEQRPWLFVVKKNKTVLERLYRWIENHVANTHDAETGRKIVSHLPLLLIDDEADNASVDTGEQIFDGEGKPDKEHEPTAINSRIRKILHTFSRSAFVGYTATPFANIFIHEKGATLDEGPDLFPSSFIINLAAPSNYIGPARVFGLMSADGSRHGLPLVRKIQDHSTENGLEGWMPTRHKNGHKPLFNGLNTLPPSLVEAIDAFLIACAVRQLRGQEAEHSSMLIHVTRFNNVQKEVFDQVEDHLLHMRQRLLRKIDHQQIVLRLKTLWLQDFVPTESAIRLSALDQFQSLDIAWEDVLEVLPELLSDISTMKINGTAKEALDYTEHKGTGLKVIAIGGDKLARGLTLEGLCVSYFLRASKMYDTLMQMGRWFGYRPGYLDLCRLYTTGELTDWFEHIADAAEELREEFDLMAASGATPREYGLKVQSHSVLMVTSPLKMRTARNLRLSFSGQLLETVSLYKDTNVLEKNFEALSKLVLSLKAPEVDPQRTRAGAVQKWKGYLWHSVSSAAVMEFLTSYRTHPEAYKVNSNLLAEFISSLNAIGELDAWTVALIGGGDGRKEPIGDFISIEKLKRSHNASYDDRYSIGRLLSPRDEAIDLSETEWMAALQLTQDAWHSDPARSRDGSQLPEAPNGPSIRRIKGFGAQGIPAQPEKGLLLLYLLDPITAEAGFSENAPPVAAFGISFPGSNSGLKVEYKANNVLWEQEYGPAE